MNINSITVLSGYGKDKQQDKVESITLKMGEVISIVGPTGSGKTTLIDDIAMFADRNTPSMRKVLVNETEPPAEYFLDPSKNPIAYITQHTNFLSDLPVDIFLETHARIRQKNRSHKIVEETLEFANRLTGEPIVKATSMTELSGGQTRALLIADAVIIGNSPIILLDEIENAGINRTKALEALRGYEKIFIFVTHDPRIALLSDYRLIMKNGGMTSLMTTNDAEKEALMEITKIDDVLLNLRSTIREGGRVDSEHVFFKAA